jgi:hypothetical protein
MEQGKRIDEEWALKSTTAQKALSENEHFQALYCECATMRMRNYSLLEG